jgi:hypothetical protein
MWFFIGFFGAFFVYLTREAIALLVAVHREEKIYTS